MKNYSFKIYPRPDTAYQAKTATDYQAAKSNIYQRFFPRGNSVAMYAWLIFGIVGVCMGIVAFIVDLLVESLVIWKWEMTQHVMNGSGVGAAWLVFLIVSIMFAGSAAAMTIWIGPGATGSGIAELMGYFNGVHIP